MSTQPEALRLAEWIEADMTCQSDSEIAEELRRQHALIQEMLAALQSCEKRLTYIGLEFNVGAAELLQVRKVLKKAKAHK